MHVCLVTPGLSPGGAERLVCEEICHLSRLDADVSVITPFIDSEYIKEMNIPETVDFFTYSGEEHIKSFPERVQQIRNGIQNLSPDIVCSHYRDEEIYLVRTTTNLSFMFICQLNGTPLWFTENNRIIPHRRKRCYSKLKEAVPGHHEFQRNFSVSVAQRLKAEVGEYLRARALHSAEEVFVLSQRVQEEVKALYGIDSRIVRAGVPSSWLTSVEQEPEVDIGTSDRVILSVSRLDERKRIGMLISAFATAEHLHEDTCLVIGGTGEEEQRLKQQVKNLDVENRVVFEGYIPEESLLSYYKSADVFACPGYMTYGLAPLEAYSVGTKLALSIDTYVRELLEDELGVQTAEPDPTSWGNILTKLLNRSDVEPTTEIIPTWRDFVEQKYKTFI